MAQRNARPVGGIYQVGQVITSGGVLTSYTAYNRNTNDVVGLLVVEFAPSIDAQTVQQLLQPLERRRSIDSPNLIHVYDWGTDGNRLYIATDPPRGMTLRYVLDNENIDLERALDLTRQMAQGLKLLHEQGVSGVDLRPQMITVDSLVAADRVQLDDGFHRAWCRGSDIRGSRAGRGDRTRGIRRHSQACPHAPHGDGV